MSDTNKNALEYFKTNPNATEVYATTDGYVFVKKLDAINHAKTLNPDSPAVETIKNDTANAGNSKKDNAGKLGPAQLKEIKDQATKEYTELFGEAPDSKLSGAKIQELIDAKKAELKKADSGDE